MKRGSDELSKMRPTLRRSLLRFLRVLALLAGLASAAVAEADVANAISLGSADEEK